MNDEAVQKIITKYYEDVEKLPKIYQKLLKNSSVDYSFIPDKNQIIERLDLSKENKITLLQTEYVGTNEKYNFIYEHGSQRINRMYNNQGQGIAFGHHYKGIKYYYEWIDHQRYGPVIHFTKPLFLYNLARCITCTNNRCIHCALTKLPEQIYISEWFLFDKAVEEKEFRIYLKKQREKLKKYKNFLIRELRFIIIDYLRVPDYPIRLSLLYRENTSFDIINNILFPPKFS